MNLSVVRDFFLFRTSSFQTVARHPAMMWIGPLMVLAAGFAREYDQEYLLAEPWFLVLPLVASVLGAFLLTSLLYFIAWFRLQERISWWRQFRSIAPVYWMTTPLAWCYAIPIEYWTSPYNAVRFNLAMLLIVAVYRVALMIRGVQVIYQFSWRRSTIIVMLFSDLLTLVALEFVPRPIFLVMGGIQLSPSESLVLGIHFLLTFLCVITLPVWLVGGVVSAFWAAKRAKFTGYGSDGVALASGEKVEEPQATEVSTSANEVSRSVWWFVGAQLALGVVLASAMLPVQARQWHLQRVLKQKDFAAAAEMSHQMDRDRFPPHLDLPPQISYGDPVVQLYQTVNGLTQFGAADWLMDYYFEELLKDSIGKQYKHSAVESYDLIDSQGLVQYLQVVRTAKDPQSLIEPQLESLRWLIYIEEDSERKGLLEKLVEAGGFEREDIVEAHE